MFWEEENTLVISDLHFGKTGHFRKMGVAIPQEVYQADLHRLFKVIQYFKPGKIVITGDLFHSSKNQEVDYFLRWRGALAHTRFILVKGNHDILQTRVYDALAIDVVDDIYQVGPFCFTHDAEGLCNEYIFSGHIHPGIKMLGAARRSIALPCYYFTETYAILPAFSLFTGLAIMKPTKRDTVFAIAGKEVVRVS